MKKLDEILKENALYVERSAVSVEVMRWLPAVNITGCDGESCFLQEDQAEPFLTKMAEYSQQCPDLDGETIELAVAYGYLDAMC